MNFLQFITFTRYSSRLTTKTPYLLKRSIALTSNYINISHYNHKNVKILGTVFNHNIYNRFKSDLYIKTNDEQNNNTFKKFLNSITPYGQLMRIDKPIGKEMFNITMNLIYMLSLNKFII